jgi:hypothetical protein
MTETGFSSIKSASGEYVYSIKFNKMIKETMLKILQYIKFVSI